MAYADNAQGSLNPSEFPQAKEGSSSDKKTILVVDDEPDIVKVLKFRLTDAGYNVLSAIDGDEGLNKARELVPDLIILDLMLPKIDGYKVCRMLKFDKKYSKIPVIIFTAKMQESDKKIGLEVGADAYIAKPFQHEEVLSKIKELLA